MKLCHTNSGGSVFFETLWFPSEVLLLSQAVWRIWICLGHKNVGCFAARNPVIDFLQVTAIVIYSGLRSRFRKFSNTKVKNLWFHTLICHFVTEWPLRIYTRWNLATRGYLSTADSVGLSLFTFYGGFQNARCGLKCWVDGALQSFKVIREIIKLGTNRAAPCMRLHDERSCYVKASV